MDGLSIHCQEYDGYTVVSLGGELDVATAPPLRSRLDALVADGRSRLVLDVGALEFVDASGLGVLVHARWLAHKQGGWLRLARAGPMMQRLLRAASLTRVLPVFASTAQALREGTGVAGGREGVEPTVR
jgi:anti-sigma B factor antagonist